MSRRWTARTAGPADRSAQCRLFNVCFRKQKDERTFRWKYEENPHGPALEFVAEDAGGHVVGAYAFVPRRFRRDGRPLVLMQASDAMVDPSARRQGIFSGLDDVANAAAHAQGVPYAWAWSGRQSYTGFLRNTWADLGHADVWRYRFRSRRGLLRRGRLGPALALAAPLLDRLAAARDRRRFDGDVRAGLARLQPVVRFDERADALWEEAAPSVGLVGERDHAWLNWRYVDTPSRRQEAFLLPGEDGRLDGWLVAEFSAGHGYLCDHVARDEAAREVLLLAFTALAHARGVEEASALLHGHDPAAAVLAALGWPRPGRRGKLFRDCFPFIVRACPPGGDPRAEPVSRWRVADGDRDAEHLSA